MVVAARILTVRVSSLSGGDPPQPIDNDGRVGDRIGVVEESPESLPVAGDDEPEFGADSGVRDARLSRESFIAKPLTRYSRRTVEAQSLNSTPRGPRMR